MNKIFHARIALGHYLFLIVMTALTIHELWMMRPILAVPLMLLLIVIIERLIHTTYTLTTDKKLLLTYGRFSRSQTIDLKAVKSIARGSSMKIGRFAVMHYVVVYYGDQGKCVLLMPVKEEAFIKTLTAGLGTEAV